MPVSNSAVTSDQRNAADAYLNALLDDRKTPGLQYVFADTDQVLFRFNGGYADIKQKVPVRDNTTFNGYSITKTFTATAIVKLAIEGKVDLGKSTWSVLALTCHIEIFTQVHYRKSIDPATNLSELWKDVFLYHWREESQHAILDELEWIREDAKITADERDAAVNDLIDLVVAVDGILQAQAAADAQYFIGVSDRMFSEEEQAAIGDCMLKAYRWQYIVSGVQDGRFLGVLTGLISEAQAERITTALGPLM